MKILQINTADKGGGAEGSARKLFEAYKLHHHNSWLAVGRKLSKNKDIYRIPLFESKSASFFVEPARVFLEYLQSKISVYQARRATYRQRK